MLIYFLIGMLIGFCLCGILAGVLIIWSARPPRNCDVGTVEKQIELHRLYCIGVCTTHKCDYNLEKYDTETCKKCFAKWAQMPYESEVSLARKSLAMTHGGWINQ